MPVACSSLALNQENETSSKPARGIHSIAPKADELREDRHVVWMKCAPCLRINLSPRNDSLHQNLQLFSVGVVRNPWHRLDVLWNVTRAQTLGNRVPYLLFQTFVESSSWPELDEKNNMLIHRRRALAHTNRVYNDICKAFQHGIYFRGAEADA